MKNLKLQVMVETELDSQEQDACQAMEEALATAVELEELPPVECAVRLVDDATIQELNRDFRQLDRATDVLSFPLWEPDEEWILDEGETHVLLGDLVISTPQARRQAKEYGHSFRRELSFLAVHGLLHLLGYDHQTPAEEQRMFRRQEEILERCGLPR